MEAFKTVFKVKLGQTLIKGFLFLKLLKTILTLFILATFMADVYILGS